MKVLEGQNSPKKNQDFYCEVNGPLLTVVIEEARELQSELESTISPIKDSESSMDHSSSMDPEENSGSVLQDSTKNIEKHPPKKTVKGGMFSSFRNMTERASLEFQQMYSQKFGDVDAMSSNRAFRIFLLKKKNDEKFSEEVDNIWKDLHFRIENRIISIQAAKPQIEGLIDNGYSFPEKIRGFFWSKLIDNQLVITERYFELLRGRMWEVQELSSAERQTYKEISEDLKRTFGGLISSPTFKLVLADCEILMRIFSVIYFGFWTLSPTQDPIID